MQAHLLRDSRRLNRALPCLKNNRERLPIVKLLALAKSFTLFLEIIMDITDIRKCAQAFATYYLESFYIVVTYNGNGFILIGETDNFPHLIGISKQIYNSNGYRTPKKLYRDIADGQSISTKIVPNVISTTSKMYKKVRNFISNRDVLISNSCPIILRYDPQKSNRKLNNVDILISDLNKGYMLGWIYNAKIRVNSDIDITKYCISTWIDESDGNVQGKEKYMPGQDVELIKTVLVFDKNSELLRQKEYKYSAKQKLQILDSCCRNNCNLLLDDNNARNYIKLAKEKNILCSINGVIHT